MDQAAKNHIRHVMKDLADTQPEMLDHPIIELAASRWMTGSYENFIVQMELLHHRNEAVLYSCLARDGSGPLKPPFITMLLLEDTIAYAQKPFGICSGAATVTLFKFIDLADMTANRVAQVIANFTHLNAVIFSDYTERGVTQPIYQEVDVI